MNLTGSIKRAPKWALLTAGGVTLGVVGIKVWKGRATDSTATTDATEVGTPTTGPAGSPTPVITPPVIIGGDQGDNGAFADILTTAFGTFGTSLDNLVANIGTLAAGDQDIAQTAIGSNTDIATTAIANAGSPPAPAQQQPSPIVVNIPPPPAPVYAPPPPPPAPAPPPACPASHPHQSSHGCYRCERKKDGTYTHYYRDGRVVGGNRVC